MAADADNAQVGPAGRLRDDALSQALDRWRLALARDVAARCPALTEDALNAAVHRTLVRLLFARVAGVRPHGEGEGDGELVRAIAGELAALDRAAMPLDALAGVYEGFLARRIRVVAPGWPGRPSHPSHIEIEAGSTAKKATGVYYTPAHIIDYVVERTLGPLLAEATPRGRGFARIVDPACGAGLFLLRAYQYLLDWYVQRYVEAGTPGPWLRRTDAGWQLTTAERVRILRAHIYGVDIDPVAVDITRRMLLVCALRGGQGDDGGSDGEWDGDEVWRGLEQRIRCGNALVGSDVAALGDPARAAELGCFDWDQAFGEVLGREPGGFDAVIGNPPWGQKGIAQSRLERRYIRRRFESMAGIFDLFRPFVEQGVRLLAPSGRFGMVLPDIVLLKDYQATRKYLLDHLALSHIDWWGMAFASAVIDAVTICGARAPAGDDRVVRVVVRDPAAWLEHGIPQGDFRDNDRYVFNLLLTADKRAVVRALAPLPRLGQHFEAHEGVHSGNIRGELFVTSRVDDSCVPLLFGRDEIAPYGLRWRGRYVRRSAAPTRNSRQRYANLGRPGWFARDKLLVRRTGDQVLAAIDRDHRYASNNFFVVSPGPEPCGLELPGLCAILNSWFMTWYFRTIEPRKGRVFAELKIKHLAAFPLPAAVRDGGGAGGKELEQLEDLGAERAALALELFDTEPRAGVTQRCQVLDRAIDALVYSLYGLSRSDIELIEAARAPEASSSGATAGASRSHR